jgi:hypothetical protein
VTRQSEPEDLALHGVRVLGFPTAARIASRFGLDARAAQESLLDFEARGWARLTSFAGSSGWWLTELRGPTPVSFRSMDGSVLPARTGRLGPRDWIRWRLTINPTGAGTSGC